MVIKTSEKNDFITSIKINIREIGKIATAWKSVKMHKNAGKLVVFDEKRMEKAQKTILCLFHSKF
jgi:hypothetical protein